MGNIIEVRDKSGITIRCSDFQWESHIVSNHGIMEHNLHAVKEAITDPDYIFESHDTNPPLDDRRIYSKEVVSATYHSKIPYTHVIVSVCGGYGEVVTAYPVKQRKSGTSGKEALFIADGKPPL